MDTTIRNLDETAYRQLKAQAALQGLPVGELVNVAIRLYLLRAERPGRQRSLTDLVVPDDYPDGNERLSEEVDPVVYGTRIRA